VTKGPSSEIIDYYDRFAEETRLTSGPAQLEFERTKEILARTLPPAPARIFDVGGGAGVYAFWLADLGYEVHLVDASPRLIDRAGKRNREATRPIASLAVGDARGLPQPDGFADAVLLMGPLYQMLGDFEMRWKDPVARKDMMDVARALESEASIVGASAHLLGIGMRA
jgi:ubiquinone/menaquinone biosynthesis C-methylase UbiE